ncbi:MAG: helix-turn-helix domain-containing protein [Chloroflexota bacterium]|nr:helix-turn-helix domain-containing protein [Chloroflexota bacterium]
MPKTLPTESTWLTLSQASELLGVHPTTLRAWVDARLVHAFLTPGGHRRFQIAELRAFLTRRRSDNEARALIAAPDQTLQQVRQQMTTENAARQTWYQGMSDAARARHRETGARLLGLLLQFVSRSENAEHFLSEGRALVQAYGREFADANFSVSELAQAFLFFRRMIVNAACYPEGGTAPSDAEGMRLLQRITQFMDELLIATLDAYDQAARRIGVPARALPRPRKRTASLKPMRRLRR